MPIASAIGSIGGALLGGLAGGSNARPPSLSGSQSTALNSLLPMLTSQVQGAPKIDPTLQALNYNNIAQGQTGAFNAATHAMASRGLGHSGLLGDAFTQIANQAQTSRNTSDVNLQNQAIQQRQLSIQDIIGMLNVNNTPGQSTFGATMAGMAPMLAYSIQNMMNSKSGGGGGLTSGGSSSGDSYGGMDSGE